MKVTDMTNLFIGYNKEEDFRILICIDYGTAISTDDCIRQAQILADEYCKDAELSGKFEIDEFTDINARFDCDSVIM